VAAIQATGDHRYRKLLACVQLQTNFALRKKAYEFKNQLPANDFEKSHRRFFLAVARSTNNGSGSGRKFLTVFARNQKCLNHLSIDEVAVKLVQFVKPKVVALKVECLLRSIVWVAAQVSEVL
jgi:hypothetical protein